MHPPRQSHTLPGLHCIHRGILIAKTAVYFLEEPKHLAQDETPEPPKLPKPHWTFKEATQEPQMHFSDATPEPLNRQDRSLAQDETPEPQIHVPGRAIKLLKPVINPCYLHFNGGL